jgi:hypothetical protein
MKVVSESCLLKALEHLKKGQAIEMNEKGEITLPSGWKRWVRVIPFCAAYLDSKTAEVLSKHLKQIQNATLSGTGTCSASHLDTAKEVTKEFRKSLKRYNFITNYVVKGALRKINQQNLAFSLDIPMQVFENYPTFGAFIYKNHLANVIQSMKSTGHEVRFHPTTYEPSILVDGEYTAWTKLEPDVFMDKEGNLLQWDYMHRGLVLHSKGDWRKLRPFKSEKVRKSDKGKYYFEIVTVHSKQNSAFQRLVNFDFGHSWVRLSEPSKDNANHANKYSVGYFWNRDRFMSPDIFEFANRKKFVTRIEIDRQKFEDMKVIMEHFQECMRSNTDPESPELKELYEQFKNGSCADFALTLAKQVKPDLDIANSKQLPSSGMGLHQLAGLVDKTPDSPLSEQAGQIHKKFSHNVKKWFTVAFWGARPQPLTEWQIKKADECIAKRKLKKMNSEQRKEFNIKFSKWLSTHKRASETIIHNAYLKLASEV